MKKQFLFIALLLSSLGIAQSINDYKAVIIPLKYDFMKTENQYRLATLTKFNLNKAGFEAYYTNEDKPLINRCSLLDLDVVNEKGFLTTKLYVVFKDCYGKVVFQSDLGVSREKSFEVAYNEALNKAFESVTALNYVYSGNEASSSTPIVAKEVRAVDVNVRENTTVNTAAVAVPVSSTKVLYAQPTANGFQLVDSTPSVVMKMQKTAKADYFLAQKGESNGVVSKKDNQWFFEYYQGDTLMSEKLDIKF